jgi:hypothetical protein
MTQPKEKKEKGRKETEKICHLIARGHRITRFDPLGMEYQRRVETYNPYWFFQRGKKKTPTSDDGEEGLWYLNAQQPQTPTI